MRVNPVANISSIGCQVYKNQEQKKKKKKEKPKEEFAAVFKKTIDK